jgi:hypothetical protein
MQLYPYVNRSQTIAKRLKDAWPSLLGDSSQNSSRHIIMGYVGLSTGCQEPSEAY